MPKAKAKSKHSVSALSKAIRTNRHATPSAADITREHLDIRTAAASVEFSVEDLGLNAAKRVPALASAKTVLAGETNINVERRIRNAAVPIGVAVDDSANLEDQLSLEHFDVSKSARQLMPKRPAWSYELSSGRLHHREVEAFKKWLEDVRQLIMDRGGYPPAFEQNLQVWRQLWRVLELCDVAVIVVDARHPLLHLPPPLLYHVSCTLKKPLVVVLNKLDAVDPKDAVQWEKCLTACIPGIQGVVGYSKEALKADKYSPLEMGRDALIRACHRAHAAAPRPDIAASPKDAAAPTGHGTGQLADNNIVTEAGRITLGMVGHPNVGKSSLINGLMGGKVVSVKATPGHTKILQTLILDDSTCLCDSPGIVFPRLDVPREAQIVGMLIPIAQVREPFSAIRWVMERSPVPLDRTLGLKPVSLQQVLDLQEAGVQALQLETLGEETGAVPWSPMLICAQYALQRGFKHSGRPDCQQAGMEILQRVLDGRIAYVVPPPATYNPLQISPQGKAGEAVPDSDDDWQVHDADYESGHEEEEAAKATNLLEALGAEPRNLGSGSIGSRKKQKKRERLEALAREEEKAAGPLG
mmetsp:Transcript_15368/g.30264  ORF Transcript_15368/g.30264 Transcript_15368/m.30264 type:complete len:584 (+) Transcript_15368:53-1804(+)|eukprot:CAMPEP_0172715614 /NCGR_PEP_ID=MMETSP1074-20121228/67643_1 /TAXON_ID=2916 /ORGANISM="Ceratium fusus, Strain PA161109" /LENGTH=583 /DNA_ID=CAMNT_0013540207 /DNA_START=42 /DNA_END=1793 /DNA_ORIENTATION=+